jgi:hypothetical protein
VPYIRSDVKDVFGVITECKCPKCDGIHKLRINWEGRGMPRKFCSRCLQNMPHVTGGIDDDSAFSKYALINYMVHTGRS